MAGSKSVSRGFRFQLGSRLILFHSQNRAIAEKKVSEQGSYRVATRLQSLSLPNMISIRLRREYRRLACLTGFLRDFRSGMQTFIPLSFNESLNQSASCLLLPFLRRYRGAPERTYRRNRATVNDARAAISTYY